jgi:ankyrin repeat protein
MKNLNEQLSDAIQKLDKQQILSCIEQGADVNFVNDSGKTVFTDLVLVTKYKYGDDDSKDEHELKELELEELGIIELMKLLLEKGADINLYKKELGITALYIAVNQAKVETVKFLLDNGANPNHNYFPDEEAEVISTVLNMAYIDKQVNVQGYDERFGKIIELLEDKGAIL